MKTAEGRGTAPRTSVRAAARLQERLRRSRAPRALAALGMSLLLWLYASSITTLGQPVLYPSVPVGLRNIRGDVVLVGTAPTVKVRVQSTGGADTDPGQPEAYVDMAGAGPGAVSLPVHIDGLRDSQVVSIEPPQVRLMLETAEERNMPVDVRVISDRSDTPTESLPSEPDNVIVRGSAKAVRRVRAVTAVLELPDVAPGLTQAVPVQAVDRAGRPVQDVTLTPSEVDITIPASPVAPTTTP